ncbi:hypothetical protein DTO012A9_10297 [Penicillium roqueforti]|nr:hypothetical protein DTO012A9_10297 [Penicillium roqueforti]
MMPQPIISVLTLTALLCGLFYFFVASHNFSVRNISREYPALQMNNEFSFIQNLYRPYIHPIDALDFDDQNGKTYSLPQMPRFTKPLRDKLLILDVDTRPLDGPATTYTLQYMAMITSSSRLLALRVFMAHGVK